MSYPEDNNEYEEPNHAYEEEVDIHELKGHLISDKAYDSLKFVVVILLPGLATLYFSVAQIWGLPAAEQVLGTSAAVATFLGLFLRVSTKSYEASDMKYDGNLVVSAAENGKLLYSLEFTGDPYDIPEMPDIRFRVKN